HSAVLQPAAGTRHRKSRALRLDWEPSPATLRPGQRASVGVVDTMSRFTRKTSALTMTCRVEVDIRANPEKIWSLLTDAKSFPRWNSTVTGIDGQIGDGARLKIHVPGTSRTFTPT